MDKIYRHNKFAKHFDGKIAIKTVSLKCHITQKMTLFLETTCFSSWIDM